MSDIVYIFAHIPKTGGTTIRKHFEKYLSPYEFVHLASANDDRVVKKGIPPFSERSEEDRQKVRVVLGHQVTANTHKLFPGKAYKYIVFIREPVSWVVSRYNWKMNIRRQDGKEPLEFDEWYKGVKQRQSQLIWLVKKFGGGKYTQQMSPARRLKAVNEIVEKFDVVSLTERIDLDCPVIFKTIGVPEQFESANVAGQRHPKLLSPNDELREKLAKPLAVDIEFYETWKAKTPLLNL